MKKHILIIANLFILSSALPSCSAIQKGEAALGITQSSIAALNVSLEKDAIAGILALANEKPGLAAKDLAYKVIDDIASQITAQGSGANQVTVAISSTAQTALKDYRAKATKAQWLTDGMTSALTLLTATAPAGTPAA